MRRYSSEYPLNLHRSFECGEIFGWKYIRGKWFICINGEPVMLSQSSENSINVVGDVPDEDLYDFFSDNIDYKSLQDLATTEYEWKVLAYCKGARIIKQDPEMVLLTSILTPRQKWTTVYNWVTQLCEEFGDPYTIDGQPVYDFPSTYIPEDLPVHFGNKSEYFQTAVKMLRAHTPNIGLCHISAEAAMETLQQFPGVGPKVAAYVALHAFGYTSPVPIDVHVKRAVEREYDGAFPYKKFGELAGVYAQYMYAYEKEFHS